MPLRTALDQLPVIDCAGQGRARAARGWRAGVSIHTLEAGNPGRPHVHAAEQLGYVLRGECMLSLVTAAGDRPLLRVQHGDFFRVPAMTVHWTEAIDGPCTLVEFHAPPAAVGDGDGQHALIAPWEQPTEPVAPTFRVSAASYRLEESEAPSPRPSAPLVAGLLARGDSVPIHTVHNPDGSELTTQLVYGQTASVMVGGRPAGYHSRPHVHACEQLNLVVSGILEGYVVDPTGGVHASPLAEGDLWRVPSLAPHWIYNRSDQPCRLVELHIPGLHGDPLLHASSVSLVGPDEPPATPSTARNIYVELDDELVSDAERSIGENPDPRPL